MRVLRRVSLVLALSIVAALLVVSDSQTPIVLAPPQGPVLPSGPRAVVALGDSTLSGEGVGDYLPGTVGENGNWCHRSRDAEVDQVDLAGVSARFNLACSGAGAAQVGFGAQRRGVGDSQAATLTTLARQNRVVAVVVAVGANDDPQFSDVVGQCTQAWLQRGAEGCADRLGRPWRDHVASMVPKVAGGLRDVRSAMRAAGYPDDAYQLVLQSYAAPVGPNLRADLQSLAGCPFRTPDLRWVQQTAVPELSSGLRAAAQDAGVRFLDLSRAGIGHEACSGAPADEWFTRLSVNFALLRDDRTAGHALQESFHPNAKGHAEIARCVSDFLAGPAGSAACLPDFAGELRPVAGQAVQALAAGDR